MLKFTTLMRCKFHNLVAVLKIIHQSKNSRMLPSLFFGPRFLRQLNYVEEIPQQDEYEHTKSNQPKLVSLSEEQNID